jgi:hypothetical protein
LDSGPAFVAGIVSGYVLTSLRGPVAIARLCAGFDPLTLLSENYLTRNGVRQVADWTLYRLICNTIALGESAIVRHARADAGSLRPISHAWG